MFFLVFFCFCFFFWQTKIEIKNANFFPVQVSAMNVTLNNYKSQVGLCSVQAFSVKSRTSTIVSLYTFQQSSTYHCITHNRKLSFRMQHFLMVLLAESGMSVFASLHIGSLLWQFVPQTTGQYAQALIGTLLSL